MSRIKNANDILLLKKKKRSIDCEASDYEFGFEAPPTKSSVVEKKSKVYVVPTTKNQNVIVLNQESKQSTGQKIKQTEKEENKINKPKEIQTIHFGPALKSIQNTISIESTVKNPEHTVNKNSHEVSLVVVDDKNKSLDTSEKVFELNFNPAPKQIESICSLK